MNVKISELNGTPLSYQVARAVFGVGHVAPCYAQWGAPKIKSMPEKMRRPYALIQNIMKTNRAYVPFFARGTVDYNIAMSDIDECEIFDPINKTDQAFALLWMFRMSIGWDCGEDIDDPISCQATIEANNGHLVTCTDEQPTLAILRCLLVYLNQGLDEIDDQVILGASMT